jgi:hypothetical protein
MNKWQRGLQLQTQLIITHYVTTKQGQGGTGTETEYTACVYKVSDTVVIQIKDKNGSQVAGGNGQDFNSAYIQLVGQTDKLGKTIGKDLPMPINPDQQ